MLGCFNPFFRNHNGDSSLPQEFYLWETVAEAARKTMSIRYRLLDYIYTALYKQSTVGTPLLNPLLFTYPEDTKTFAIELQFFYGEHILVSPVTEENSTSVDIYLPKDLFYDFYTYAAIQGTGAVLTLKDIDFTTIPLHIKSGAVIPMRSESGYTTTDVRMKPFSFIVAPTVEGKAAGELYLDDGDTIVQYETSKIKMSYHKNILNIDGDFSYQAECNTLQDVTILGIRRAPTGAYWSKSSKNNDVLWYTCHDGGWKYDVGKESLTITIEEKLDGAIRVKYE
jgi:alpha-glucosidase